MAIYAIGDVQGCYDELRTLLDKIEFSPHKDRLWFTGDLVNRGPKSLDVLRFVKGLGNAAVTVLGNHDLHLLAVAHRGAAKKKDTLAAILDAPDRDELLLWLRHRPLLHYENKVCLIHAGLSPHWNLEQARKCAAEVETVLRGPGFSELLDCMYGDEPDLWEDTLQSWERYRFILNCFTRMRYCDGQGRLDLKQKGAPGSQQDHLLPWFAVPQRKSAGIQIIFGHWSTLGFSAVAGCYCVDTGCLWGGQLTALRVDEEMRRICLDCPGAQKPGSPSLI